MTFTAASAATPLAPRPAAAASSPAAAAMRLPLPDSDVSRWRARNAFRPPSRTCRCWCYTICWNAMLAVWCWINLRWIITFNIWMKTMRTVRHGWARDLNVLQSSMRWHCVSCMWFAYAFVALIYYDYVVRWLLQRMNERQQIEKAIREHCTATHLLHRLSDLPVL